jgi:16S rRNA C1402 (ribose-2'-O) methylase RsmI
LTKENKVNELQSYEDYTARTRAFLALARQIHQVSTDYDILAESVDHLRKQLDWFQEKLPMASISTAEELHKSFPEITHSNLSDVFDSLVKEVKLIGTYTKLYLDSSKIGVDECFAMSSQKDSEVHILSSVGTAQSCNQSEFNRSTSR